MDASTAPDVMSGLSADQLCDVRREHKDEKIAKHLGELTPISYQYVNSDEILVSLVSTTGDILTYTLKARMLAKAVTMSMVVINDYANRINIKF
jgi:hypothetical protein